jgi:hypothetical protein
MPCHAMPMRCAGAAFLGGCFISFVLPSLWFQVMHDFKALRIGHAFAFALPIAGGVLTLLWFGTIATLYVAA